MLNRPLGTPRAGGWALNDGARTRSAAWAVRPRALSYTRFACRVQYQPGSQVGPFGWLALGVS